MKRKYVRETSCALELIEKVVEMRNINSRISPLMHYYKNRDVSDFFLQEGGLTIGVSSGQNNNENDFN